MTPVVIGIAGGTGSGKTTVTANILAQLPADRALLIQHDWYYRDRAHLAPAERDRINFDEPAALDNDLLAEHLTALKAGRTIACPQYDFATHTRKPATRPLEPRTLVLVEGILLFAVPALRDLFDLRLFVDTPDDIRLFRRIRRDLSERGRDIASIEAQYLRTVRPMHEQHVAPSRAYAHIIIPEGGENAHGLDVIVRCLLNMLSPGSGG